MTAATPASTRRIFFFMVAVTSFGIETTDLLYQHGELGIVEAPAERRHVEAFAVAWMVAFSCSSVRALWKAWSRKLRGAGPPAYGGSHRPLLSL